MEDITNSGPLLGKENDDILGMDESIKLKTRAKVAKIDDERMFSRAQGLEHLVKNYSKVVRVIKKNDAKLKHKLESITSSSMRKRAKCNNEYDNLGAILQFYQLWCHGLFPKSNFKECIRMVRVYGGKSPRMRLYRRELLDQQINKLKEEKGLAIESSIVPVETSNQIIIQEGQGDVDLTESSIAQPLATGVTVENDEDDDDDDWSFMKRGNARNALFIDDDDEELYETPMMAAHDGISQTKVAQRGSKSQPSSMEATQNNENVEATKQTPEESTLAVAGTVFSDFNDDLEEYPEEMDQQTVSNEVVNDDNDDQELELMREMGF